LNIKNESHLEKQRAKKHNQKSKRFAKNETHQVKNFAYTASKPSLQKDNGLQTDLANTLTMKSQPP
jgi:hypothetical protein